MVMGGWMDRQKDGWIQQIEETKQKTFSSVVVETASTLTKI